MARQQGGGVPARHPRLPEQRATGDFTGEAEYLDRLRTAVADVVARQRETGINLVNDGEFGHSMGARFHDVELSNARFQLVDMTGVTIRGAVLVNVDISGKIENLRVNGVDVVPPVKAELDRRYPDRRKMRPADADGYRGAWAILERLWGQTVARARGLDQDLPHERVEGEWSFIQTLRHRISWSPRGWSRTSPTKGSALLRTEGMSFQAMKTWKASDVTDKPTDPGEQGWVGQARAVTSRAERTALSSAPSIQAAFMLVWSPAKWALPSTVAVARWCSWSWPGVKITASPSA